MSARHYYLLRVIKLTLLFRLSKEALIVKEQYKNLFCKLCTTNYNYEVRPVLDNKTALYVHLCSLSVLLPIDIR